MHGFTLLVLVLPLLHAEFFLSDGVGVDADVWDSTISAVGTGSPLPDSEETATQNAIGLPIGDIGLQSLPLNLDESIFPEDFLMKDMKDDPLNVFTPQSELDYLFMDQCSQPGNVAGRKVRPREVFCTNGKPPEVNNNPSLAGLDASESIIDPDNRRQCDFRYKTLCCDGGSTGVYMLGCFECKHLFCKLHHT